MMETPIESPDGELEKRVAQRTRELATANEELKKTELESRMIVDRIPGLVGVLAPSGEVEALNQRMLEYFGKPFEEMKRWEESDIIHAEDLPRVIRVFAQAIGSGVPLEYEARLRRFDGVYRWFQVRGFQARDRTGGVGRWYLLITDIYEQTRAEDAVRTSERTLKLIIDTIPAVAWSARADGSADFFNRHYLDYVGLSAEQVKDWGWMAAIHPDDLAGLAAAWQRIIASEGPGEAEARFRRFDGAHRWFLFRANPLRDESGKVVKWYGTNIDIEDRKRGEESLRATEMSWRQIVDNIPGFVVTTAPGGEVEFLDHSARGVTHFDGGDRK
jgi:PAS domain S-box-containing protein